MPRRFSRKRSRRDPQTSQTYVQRVNMTPFLSSGILPGDIGQIPMLPSTDGTSHFKCESVVAGVVGAYNMDFTRLVTMSAPVGEFSHIRIHKGGMSIKRIDNGATTGMFQARSAATPGVIAGANMTQFGVVPSLLRIHYIRLPTSMSTTSDWTIANFMQDPRRKCRTLRVGRKLSFSFHPVSYLRRHMTTMARTGLAVGDERDRLVDLTLPARDRKLGWVPTGLFAPLQDSTTYSASALAGGLTPDVWRIVSPTVIFVFDWNGAGAFNQAIYSFADPPVADALASYTPMGQPLITRSEWCKFSVKGLRLSQVAFPGQCYVNTAFMTNVATNTVNELFKTPAYNLQPTLAGNVPAYPDMTGPFLVVPGPLQAAAGVPIPDG